MKPSRYIVDITSITTSEILGNFTGNYLYSSFNDTDPDGGIVYITEGGQSKKNTIKQLKFYELRNCLAENIMTF
jgi:hypothetical protein